MLKIKKILLFCFLLNLGVSPLKSQEIIRENTNSIDRLTLLKSELNKLSEKELNSLNETVDVSVSNIKLSDFIRAVATSHGINVSISHNLSRIQLTHNFSSAKVKDVFLLLCKEYNLTIDITGNILSFKRYLKVLKKREIGIVYDTLSKNISIDLKSDTLSQVFRIITEKTGQNILYSQDLGNKLLSGYIQQEPLITTVEKIALMNNLKVVRTKDNFLLISEIPAPKGVKRKESTYTANIPGYYEGRAFFEIKDTLRRVLKVDFSNVPIKTVVNNVSKGLGINTYITSPLSKAGTLTLKTDSISYENLLRRMLENTPYFYSNKNGMYCIGKRKQVSLRETRTIPLKYRSIEALDRASTTSNNNIGYFPNSYNSYQRDSYIGNNYRNYNYSNGISNNTTENHSPIKTITGKKNNYNVFGNYETKIQALLSIFPKELLEGIEITSDVEQNSFIVSGDSQKVQRISEFIKEIDKPVPVILIEVMILEVNKTASISTGVEWGLGDSPVLDKGNIYPATNLTLGAKTINKIIGGFNDFGLFNVGKVVPNFYAKIEALETNGDLKIRSTPKLATLNGHSANLSNGERAYYAVTRRDIIGFQNPQTTEIKNYVPIDANLSIDIRPLVSSNNQITLGVRVVQSSFNNKRVDKEAPPGINSREFTSTIRVANQDIVILGGLEENLKRNNGTGVPLLSKIPVLKWLFSKRNKVDSRTKLTVLIKPTIIE